MDPHTLTVIGLGRQGLESLSPLCLTLLKSAAVIAGHPSHLHHVASYPTRLVPLQPPVETWIPILESELTRQSLVVLASGDPLFFGIGRLLLTAFPAEQLIFHPHVSSIQLAFSRARIPWQNAEILSLHGRAITPLLRAIKQGSSPIALLTDNHHTPAVIADTVQQLQGPSPYRMWVCCCLGAEDETVMCLNPSEVKHQVFAMPNIVILERLSMPQEPSSWPLLGIPDPQFHTFADQPGLITKREVRSLTLSLLELPTTGVIWDIGAGTGSISIEIARLAPRLTIYAIEKNAAGVQLIQQNCKQFQVNTVSIVAGSAPEVLEALPDPDRVILGGGGSLMKSILNTVIKRIRPKGLVVGNFATLETCLTTQAFFKEQSWSVELLQVSLSRSVTIAGATRFSPLNPVILLQAKTTGIL